MGPTTSLPDESFMGLTEYRRKRNFEVTAEPSGGRATRSGTLVFVIQKHAASHLHYDFRLELDGVLKSWAVPKGPSLDPATKRLAMQVEDHPLEYGCFEGIIPEGEYGGGTVMLWDHGTWEPARDPRQGFRDGSLKFMLHGEKLEGGWMLVRKGGVRGGSNERHWFLFKERDRFARPAFDVTTTKPLSVTTGRDLDKIAEQANRVWGRDGEVSRHGQTEKTMTRSSRPSTGRKKSGRTERSNRATGDKVLRVKTPPSAASKVEIKRLLEGSGAKQAPVPRAPTVELATLAKAPPEGDDWLHEIKFDGYRMLATIERGVPRLISRNGKDWTSKFPSLMDSLAELPVTNTILDGEIVVMRGDGTTSYQALQNALHSRQKKPFLYFLFDVLHLDGHDMRPSPIETRKELLRAIVPGAKRGVLRFSEHVIGNGARFFAEAARLQLEGIVSKRLGRPYLGGRQGDWLKIKCSPREEFVIGGFTQPAGARSNFGALALGYFDQNHEFRYAGRVGTGFDEKTLAALHRRLLKLVQSKSPFANLSGTTGQARGVTWVKPKLVAQIAFSQWTHEGQLRHPSFQGLRADKKACDVVRDDPIEAPLLKSATKAKATRRSKSKVARQSLGKALHSDGSAEFAGVRISHPNKVLYPKEGYTKLDLARYYELVAPWMLPHVENRLVSLVRCPAGSGQKCFFQKHPAEGAPDWLRRVPVKEQKKLEDYLAVDDLPGLISLVQMGVLEIHLWGSRADQFEKPDRLIFDLDPDPAVGWPQVVTAAKEVRLLLEDLGLTSYVKTTGGKGLHLVVPVKRKLGWRETKAFCRAVADFMVAAAPKRYIATMSKAARKGKIFVDYLRNDRGATAIAPYSTRAKPGAPVSVPLSWDELSDRITSDHFNIENLPDRLAKLSKDPWAGI